MNEAVLTMLLASLSDADLEYLSGKLYQEKNNRTIRDIHGGKYPQLSEDSFGGDSFANIYNEYYSATEEVVLVPLKLKVHAPTDVVFSYEQPSIFDLEGALKSWGLDKNIILQALKEKYVRILDNWKTCPEDKGMERKLIEIEQLLYRRFDDTSLANVRQDFRNQKKHTAWAVVVASKSVKNG